MYDVSVPMAIVDYIPVILFLCSAVILQHDLYNKMSKGCFALFAGGTIFGIIAGLFQASWKLLYAAGICDFRALNSFFMPAQSLGLLMSGFAVVFMLCFKQKKSGVTTLAVAPPLFTGSFIFIGMMVVGLGALCGGLSVVGKKLGKGKVWILFVLSWLLSMCMGYLSSRDMTLAWVNWAEEGINVLSQLMLFLGVLTLRKAGLSSLELNK